MNNQISRFMLEAAIKLNIQQALLEDLGGGDITGRLICEEQNAVATIISKEEAIICGRPWADAVLHYMDPALKIQWHIQEGQRVKADQILLTVEGNARALLSAERSVLNFLQLLSGVATRCRYFADKVSHTDVKLLDTRKTIPGLRVAQKYAVTFGGCFNHRFGLFDAFLIKENHIHACGSIAHAVTQARKQAPDKKVEVEVESLHELEQALTAGADIIMMDNFTPEQLRQGVALTKNRVLVEASGNVNVNTLTAIAETGVDFISMGTLTKDCQAIDLSMCFT
ncbi:MAG: carboxylating nicotinate-nucleotide diphosphorylase [Endozoicomonadaceae bacterium]|nr:carboxylating nicotinate-nucleotide diphosphorylase [Endozoicomonadaceae bacterium]